MGGSFVVVEEAMETELLSHWLLKLSLDFLEILDTAQSLMRLVDERGSKVVS
jgi:hypothetical protein